MGNTADCDDYALQVIDITYWLCFRFISTRLTICANKCCFWKGSSQMDLLSERLSDMDR
jgi:hypothetical protein